jgi:hypothetical protein
MTPEEEKQRERQAASAGKAYGQACNKEARRLVREMFGKFKMTDKEADDLIVLGIDPARSPDFGAINRHSLVDGQLMVETIEPKDFYK